MPHIDRQKTLSIRGFTDGRYADAFFMDSPDPVAYVAPNGEFIAVNLALTQFLGYSESEMLGKTWQDFTVASDIPGDESEVEKLLSDKTGWGYSLLKQYRRKDGQRVWINLHVRVIRDPETGEVEHFISYIIPLPGVTQYKAEKEKGGKVTVRPVTKWTTFLIDNWQFTLFVVAVFALALFDELVENGKWLWNLLGGGR